MANITYTVNSLLSPVGLIDFKLSRGGLIGEEAYERGGLKIDFLKILNNYLNVFCLKIEKTIHIV